jgi:hypothetical protein
MSDELRYPTGRFHPSHNFTAESRRRALDAIAALPAELRAAVAGLDDARLDTPYRDGGWTVRQVVHHLPDSHLNAYVRHKLAATEELPTIKPYHEARWAELADGRGGDVEVSLRLLEALHERWSRFLGALAPADFARGFLHPEMPGKTLSLDFSVEMYAWHGRHHVGHVTALRARNGW